MSNRAATPQILDAMCEGVSLRTACKTYDVAVSTFLLWVKEDQTLAEQYAHARARLLDVQAEELEEIGAKAAMAETAVEVAGLRLQSDNRKWLLSKLAPKKYGDKLELAGDPANPVGIAVIERRVIDAGN